MFYQESSTIVSKLLSLKPILTQYSWIISGPDHTQIIVFSSVGGVFFIGTVAMVTLLIRKFYTRSKYEHFDWPDHDTDHYDGECYY